MQNLILRTLAYVYVLCLQEESGGGGVVIVIIIVVVVAIAAGVAVYFLKCRGDGDEQTAKAVDEEMAGMVGGKEDAPAPALKAAPDAEDTSNYE